MANDKWSGSNPWLGLAPYTEGTPLYGRTKESIQLADIIKDYTASVVFGKSGIGKSSLLSAGISPLLREENYIPVRIRLVHNTEVSYIEQIETKVRETVNCNDRLPSNVNNLGLWDFFHRHSFLTENGTDCIPVIILDQFEEIYTLTDADHKKDIIAFFNELSSLLNDIKPDNVIEEEQKHSILQNGSDSATPKRGIIKRSAASALNYTSTTTFRFVICLREDKLYLLERNSANIPSLKANRYNLQALSPESALEVIMCPRPELFSNEEATSIIDKLADMGDEGVRTIDPAILSLFLYKYYEKQGDANYDNIFADYYQEATKDIDGKSIAFLEDHLLTLGGYRNQIPLDDALSSGVAQPEIDSLLNQIILRTEKRKGVDYIEFSHDRLCAEANKRREGRKLLGYRKKIYNICIALLVALVLLVSGVLVYLAICNNVIPAREKEIVLPDDNNYSINIKYSETITDSVLFALDSCHSVSVNFFHRSVYSFDNMLIEYGLSGISLIGYAPNAKTATILTSCLTSYSFTSRIKNIYVLYNPDSCVLFLPENNHCTLHIPYGTMHDILSNSNKRVLNTVYDIKEMSVLETWYRRFLYRAKIGFHTVGENAYGQKMLITPLSWSFQILSIVFLIPLLFVYCERKNKVFNNIKFSLCESCFSYLLAAMLSSFLFYVLFLGFELNGLVPVYGPICVTSVMYLSRKYLILQSMRNRYLNPRDSSPFFIEYRSPDLTQGRFFICYFVWISLSIFVYICSLLLADGTGGWVSDVRPLFMPVVFWFIHMCNRRCRTVGVSCWIQMIPGARFYLLLVE